MTPPSPGVGVVCLPGLREAFQQIAPACDVLEIEPQPFWRAADGEAMGAGKARFDRDAVEWISGAGLPVLVHSVGCPVGGTELGDPAQLDTLGETLDAFSPAWWSEHLSFFAAGAGAQRHHLGFLLPPVQSAEGIDIYVGHIKALQDRFGRPFAFETGVNYLKPQAGEIPDGAFWGEIAERADSGILLDLHNVWTNARNGRARVEEVLAELPKERIWEMHLANGQDHRGYWLDAHSGLPPGDLLSLAQRVAPGLPELRAIVLEIVPDYLSRGDVTADGIAACLEALRGIAGQVAETPKPAAAHPSSGAPGAASDGAASASLPEPAAWEEAFAAALAGDDETADRQTLAEDPAIEVYRDLVDVRRKGTLAGVLPLSIRYIWTVHGEGAVERLFREFGAAWPVEPYPAREAANFATFLRGRNLAPYLEDLAAIELARARAAALGEAQQVQTRCDPNRLLDYIGNPTGRPAPPRAPCTAEVAPP